ncbi:hypothetical protein JOAD_77 [Erwinia phage vB_EamM_Joad]|uniref:Uncharacterized protein n=1 Tax=Erwinia phage vB_EamM_Joad TaxID=2026081 RepID=A0A223LJ93_9CAUD|nr:hypothetical protein JOAD_77 [Erwinia phage vB_EamM_Joad]
MLIARYNHIRGRLTALHDMIQHKQFSVWVAPVMFMDLEELRHRPTFQREDHVADHQFYETPQMRSMTVSQLVEILPNMNTPNDIGYCRPNEDIPLLYEGIQEYIMLWCEIIKDVPEVPFPPLDELYLLESFAYTLFPAYRSIKPYLDDKERQEQNGINARMSEMGLASFMGLFKQERFGAKMADGQLSFVSYLDMLKQSMNWTESAGQTGVKSATDSLLAQDNSDIGMAAWFMMK